MGIAVEDSGDLVVADMGAHAVIRVAPDGVQSVVSSGGQLVSPSGIAVEDRGHLVVTDLGSQAVFRLDAVSGAQTVIYSDTWLHPSGITRVHVAPRVFSDDFDSGTMSGWSSFQSAPVVTTQPWANGETWPFPETAAGSCSDPQMLVILVASTSGNAIELAAWSEGPFPIVAHPSSPLDPGESTVMLLMFCPWQDNGELQTGTLEITTTDPALPLITIHLEGQETP
jgi:hypothetical protein